MVIKGPVPSGLVHLCLYLFEQLWPHLKEQFQTQLQPYCVAFQCYSTTLPFQQDWIVQGWSIKEATILSKFMVILVNIKDYNVVRSCWEGLTMNRILLRFHSLCLKIRSLNSVVSISICQSPNPLFQCWMFDRQYCTRKVSWNPTLKGGRVGKQKHGKMWQPSQQNWLRL